VGEAQAVIPGRAEFADPTSSALVLWHSTVDRPVFSSRRALTIRKAVVIHMYRYSRFMVADKPIHQLVRPQKPLAASRGDY
jgi:hypothetical protein